MLSVDHIRLLAVVELAKRELEGIKAHVDYQRNPIGWIIDVLGVEERTLRWSINSERSTSTLTRSTLRRVGAPLRTRSCVRSRTRRARR